MMKKSARRTRRTHTPAFKAQVAIAALREGAATHTVVGHEQRLASHAAQHTALVQSRLHEKRRSLLARAPKAARVPRHLERQAGGHLMSIR